MYRLVPNWLAFSIVGAMAGGLAIWAMGQAAATRHYEATDRVNEALRAAYEPKISYSGNNVVITNSQSRVSLSSQEYNRIMRDN